MIPILVTLGLVLLFLNHQVTQKGKENIEQTQESLASLLQTEIKNTSLKLSHLVYVNDNEIVNMASGMENISEDEQYNYKRKMTETTNFVIEPVKDVVSIGFYMKSNKKIFFRNDIDISIASLRKEDWYKEAQKEKNQIVIGAYDIGEKNQLIQNGGRNTLILVYSLSPNNFIDREERVEAICAYQISGVVDRIKKYNTKYANGKSALGITQIVDQKGKDVFSDDNMAGLEKGNIVIQTPLSVGNNTWYIESYVNQSDLSGGFWASAMIALLAAATILILAGYFSRFFLNGLVRPVENVIESLKAVEDGNLNVRVEPKGTKEIKMMAHQFNAMVKRLRNLIAEYEERVNSKELTDEILFAKLLRNEIDFKIIKRNNPDLLTESYILLKFHFEEGNENVLEILERNNRFVTRCISYLPDSHSMLCYYRVNEEDYEYKLLQMISVLQKAVNKDKNISFSVCISTLHQGIIDIYDTADEVDQFIHVRHLLGKNSVINLPRDIEFWNQIIRLESRYEELAKAVYACDEKKMNDGKKELFTYFNSENLEIGKMHVYAAILAISKQLEIHQERMTEIFMEEYNYIDKIDRIINIRNLQLWVTNYFAWIMDYSMAKLKINETDVIVKAKRYIANQYENPGLKLKDVAEYVGLNEKYFTNQFSKSEGETFTNYLLGIRMEKAKELLKTTDFKVYEIAEMVGYRNVEHFTRLFKKSEAISPTQYRKTKEIS